MTSQKLKNIFSHACRLNQLEVIEDLLNSKEEDVLSIIRLEYDQSVRDACWTGRTRIVKCILNSSDYKEHGNFDLNVLVSMTMVNSNVEIFKFLYDYFCEKSLFFDIDSKNNELFNLFCEHGALNYIKELICHAQINIYNNYEGFKLACEKDRLEVIQYLIIEKEMIISEELSLWLIDKNSETSKVALNFIESRDLNKKLNNNLDVKDKINKKVKI